jgi:hypothetical protein
MTEQLKRLLLVEPGIAADVLSEVAKIVEQLPTNYRPYAVAAHIRDLIPKLPPMQPM